MDSMECRHIRPLAIGIFIGLYAATTAMTHSINPPAHAKSLLTGMTFNLHTLGWLLLPIFLLGSIALAVACLTNYAQLLSSICLLKPQRSDSPAEQRHLDKCQDGMDIDPIKGENLVVRMHQGPEIIASAHSVLVPQDFRLADDERSVMAVLARRLAHAQAQDILAIASKEDSS